MSTTEQSHALINTDTTSTQNEEQRSNSQVKSYFEIEKQQTSSEQCTPIVSVNPPPDSEDFDPTVHAKPYSPFYSHPSTRPSMDSGKRNISIDVRQSRDIEAGLSPQPSTIAGDRSSDNGVVKEWSQSRLSLGAQSCSRKKGLTYPKRRKCDCLAGLPKRQRVMIKLLIALVIVGVMVGIAVGIAAAVNGTVYKSKNQNVTIGS